MNKCDIIYEQMWGCRIFIPYMMSYMDIPYDRYRIWSLPHVIDRMINPHVIARIWLLVYDCLYMTIYGVHIWACSHMNWVNLHMRLNRWDEERRNVIRSEKRARYDILPYDSIVSHVNVHKDPSTGHMLQTLQIVW